MIKFHPTQRFLRNLRAVKMWILENGISKATFCKWRQHYGGMGASELKRVKQLQEENAKLKRMMLI